jgi:hypothetical protein
MPGDEETTVTIIKVHALLPDLRFMANIYEGDLSCLVEITITFHFHWVQWRDMTRWAFLLGVSAEWLMSP